MLHYPGSSSSSRTRSEPLSADATADVSNTGSESDQDQTMKASPVVGASSKDQKNETAGGSGVMAIALK
jgi:hypothetical protein